MRTDSSSLQPSKFRLPDPLRRTLISILEKIKSPADVDNIMRQFRVRQASKGDQLLELGVVTWLPNMELPEVERALINTSHKELILFLKGQVKTTPPPPNSVERQLREYLRKQREADSF